MNRRQLLSLVCAAPFAFRRATPAAPEWTHDAALGHRGAVYDAGGNAISMVTPFRIEHDQVATRELWCRAPLTIVADGPQYDNDFFPTSKKTKNTRSP